MERFLFVAKACGLPASAPFRVGSVVAHRAGFWDLSPSTQFPQPPKCDGVGEWGWGLWLS